MNNALGATQMQTYKRAALAVAMAASMLCQAATYADAASAKLCHMVTVYESNSWIAGYVFASVPEAMTYAAKHAGNSIVVEIEYNIDCAGAPAGK